MIKDSGSRRPFSTGSVRDAAEGKGRFDLLPVRALTRVALHFEKGAKKYAERNWEKGQPTSVMMDSALRHAFKHLMGMRDEDHLAAAIWNLMCLAEIESWIAEGVLPAELSTLPKPIEHEPVINPDVRPAPTPPANVAPLKTCASCVHCDRALGESPCDVCDSGRSSWAPKLTQAA